MLKFPSRLKNIYFISTLVFIGWLVFFDRNDLITQYKYRQELKDLQEEKAYYLQEIEQNRKTMDALLSNPELLEQYAREKYLMKRENEEIFLLVPDSTVKEG